MKKAKRTSYVVMTNEARVLKILRERAGISMRDAGKKLSLSGSLISQIENGRENPPKQERLREFLEIYGTDLKTFTRMVNEYKETMSDEDIIKLNLSRLKKEDLRLIRVMTEQMLGKGA